MRATGSESGCIDRSHSASESPREQQLAQRAAGGRLSTTSLRLREVYRSAALARRRAGWLHGHHRRYGAGPADKRHLDDELGRQPLGAGDQQPGPEHAPRWSPDGRYLAFLSDRRTIRTTPTSSGCSTAPAARRERVTDLRRDLRVRLGAGRPAARAHRLGSRPADSLRPTPATRPGSRPKPIVVDRFQFKYDGEGYLGRRSGSISTSSTWRLGAPSW